MNRIGDCKKLESKYPRVRTFLWRLLPLRVSKASPYLHVATVRRLQQQSTADTGILALAGLVPNHDPFFVVKRFHLEQRAGPRMLVDAAGFPEHQPCNCMRYFDVRRKVFVGIAYVSIKTLDGGLDRATSSSSSSSPESAPRELPQPASSSFF